VLMANIGVSRMALYDPESVPAISAPRCPSPST
jgi:hypothetical protein